jgi:SOS-response transcriptional repressor LexA
LADRITIISDMKKLGEFLKEKRKERGYSLRDLEKLAGVTNPHIRYVEEEMRKPTFDVLMKLLNALQVEASEFLVETGYMKPITAGGKGKRIPVISWVRAGHWKEALECGEEGEFVETDAKGEFALRVEGDSMEPEFREGDIIVVDPYRKQEQNDYVVVCNAEYEATLKQLKKYGKARVLHPLNPKYEDIELTKDGGHKLIGVVVEKKKKY